ncbi:MAG: hypothetical protein GX660_26740, partial [Clostridiaceae bacterium]|nr:hypothetical protein [Clostridiaceae bacterium]
FDNLDTNLYTDFIKANTLKHDQITSDANRILAHKFDLLGSGEYDFGKKIQWLTDFKSGHTWDRKYYKYIKIIDFNNNSDAKVPWELSRFQHLITLGKAYLISKDEKYALEFKEQIEDWLRENPYLMSVNWSCTMDVSIRSVNWILGYYFFKDSKNIDGVFIKKFNQSLYLHGVYIINNLENKGGHTGNHYLSDIVGLIWLGLYFKDIAPKNLKAKFRPRYWLDFGISELEKEMQVQVNEDGTHYETSTSYHRLVTELFLLTSIVLKNNACCISSMFISRLEKMCEFLMHLTKPNGNSPLIGDADNGRFVILSDYYSWKKDDFRHLMSIAGEFFNRDDFRLYGIDFIEDALLATGTYKFINTNDNFDSVIKRFSLPSTSFAIGGYYILRNDRIQCFIRCGELALRGHGGHSHNDQLSFELNIDGEDIAIDPGNYVYTSDYKMRNLFRSTKYHNTVVVNGYEQNDINEFDLFRLNEQTFAKCKEFSPDRFVGIHYGYKEKCGIIHERTIELHDDKIVITDTLIGSKANEENWFSNLVLSKDIEPAETNNLCYLTSSSKKFYLSYSANTKPEIRDTYFSKSYGVLEKCKSISLKSSSMTIGIL